MEDFDMKAIFDSLDKLVKKHNDLLEICKKAIDENSLTVLIDYLHNKPEKKNE
jgi:hypothetical protein